MVVHGTHAMATHNRLGIHFCTSCGSYCSFRSNYLKEPCVQSLRFSGRHALRLIALGKHPGTFLRAHLARKGPKRPSDKPRTRLYGPKLAIAKTRTGSSNRCEGHSASNIRATNKHKKGHEGSANQSAASSFVPSSLEAASSTAALSPKAIASPPPRE